MNNLYALQQAHEAAVGTNDEEPARRRLDKAQAQYRTAIEAYIRNAERYSGHSQPKTAVKVGLLCKAQMNRAAGALEQLVDLARSAVSIFQVRLACD